VSTSISDPYKVGEEDTSKDNINTSAHKKSEDDIKKESNEGEVLFEMVLDSEKPERLKIYENEEDFEGFLDAVCMRHGLGKRMGLYFKINTLTKIKNAHQDPEKVNIVLDKLLDLNYKVVMVDNGFGIMDEVVAPYFEDKGNILSEEDLDEMKNEETCLKGEEV